MDPTRCCWRALALGLALTCARVEAPGPAAPTPAPAPASAAVTLPPDLVAALRDRQRCNLLKGCPPEDALVALGPGAAAAIADLYRGRAGDADRYYRSRLLVVLGRLGGRDAVACLRDALRTGRWLERVRAAWGLADAHARDALPDLRAALAEASAGGNLAVEAALRGALATLGDPVDLTPLWRALAEPRPDQIVNLRFVVEAAGRLDARAQAPVMTRWLALPDYYLKREILRALARLKDPATEPAIAAALDDPYPGVRAAAMAAMQALHPGVTHTSVDGWKGWREARRRARGEDEATPGGAPAPAADPGGAR